MGFVLLALGLVSMGVGVFYFVETKKEGSRARHSGDDGGVRTKASVGLFAGGLFTAAAIPAFLVGSSPTGLGVASEASATPEAASALEASAPPFASAPPWATPAPASPPSASRVVPPADPAAAPAPLPTKKRRKK